MAPEAPHAVESAAAGGRVEHTAREIREQLTDSMSVGAAEEAKAPPQGKEQEAQAPKNLWERADGAIPLGEPVLITLDHPEKGKIDVTLRFTPDGYRLTVDGKSFHMFARSLRDYFVTITGTEKTNGTLTVRGTASVPILRRAITVRGAASWDQKKLEDLCRRLLNNETVSFSLSTDRGQKTGYLTPVPEQK